MSFSLFGSAFTDLVTVIPASFLNYLRTSIDQAIDGTGGGTYAPSTAITIGGSGLTVSGATNISGALGISNTITLTAALDLGAGAQVNNRISVDTTTTGTTAIGSDDDIIVFDGAIAASTNVTANLPSGSASIDGVIKKISATTTMDATATVTVKDSATTVGVLGPEDAIEVYYSSDRSGWFVIGYSLAGASATASGASLRI